MMPTRIPAGPVPLAAWSASSPGGCGYLSRVAEIASPARAERTKLRRCLPHAPRAEPWVHEAVVGVDEHAAVAGPVAPAGKLGDPFEVRPRVLVPRRKAGGEDFDRPVASRIVPAA